MFRSVLTSVPALTLLLTGSLCTAAELTLLRSFSYPGPSGLSYDPQFCALWVANETRKVAMITPYGDEIMTFEAPLSRVDAIAVENNHLVLSDGNGLYQRVDRKGTPLGQPYRIIGNLSDTDGLFVDHETGEAWIADDSVSQVVRVAADGTVIHRILGKGLNPPLLEPQGVTRDPHSGNVLVVDDADASDSLFEFTADGQLLDVIHLGAGGWDAEGITIQPDTRTVFVAYDESDTISAFLFAPTAETGALLQVSDPGGCVISGVATPPAPPRG